MARAALLLVLLLAAAAAGQTFAPAAYPALYRGDFALGESELRAALAAAELKFGPESAEAGIKLARLAYTIVRWDATPWHLPPSARRGVEALPLAQRAVAVLERTLGPNHVETGKAYIALAFVLANLNRHPEGDPYGRRALVILEKAGPAGRDLELEGLLRHYADELHIVDHNVEAQEYEERVARAVFGVLQDLPFDGKVPMN